MSFALRCVRTTEQFTSMVDARLGLTIHLGTTRNSDFYGWWFNEPLVMSHVSVCATLTATTHVSLLTPTSQYAVKCKPRESKLTQRTLLLRLYMVTNSHEIPRLVDL